jgi:SP family general alpha glucoside:H+ symporter-like MFS transporter
MSLSAVVCLTVRFVDFPPSLFFVSSSTTRPGESAEIETPCCMHGGVVEVCYLLSIRAHGVRRNRPITLSVTPSSFPLDTYEATGLCHLTSVFRPLDETFFAVWNGSAQNCSREWLLQLENDVRTALPTDLEISNEEIANVRISQFWLQIKLWELFPRFGYLSTDSVHDCLTFGYPISVGRDLTILSMKLPIQSLQLHGVGMVCSPVAGLRRC